MKTHLFVYYEKETVCCGARPARLQLQKKERGQHAGFDQARVDQTIKTHVMLVITDEQRMFA